MNMKEIITKWFHEEYHKLKGRPLPEISDYIWTYYKFWIISFVAMIVIISSIISNYRYQSKDLLISGIFINTATSAEGYSYVNEDYWNYCGANNRTRVELVEARSIPYEAEQPTQDSMNAILAVDAMIISKTLDYAIVDETTVRYYDRQEMLMDLRNLFSEQQLAEWNTAESGNGIVAIDLTGTAFEDHYTLYTQPSYLIIINNTPRTDKCARFIEYLMK